MRLETTLVFHEFTTRPVEEARLWISFPHRIGSPGHDSTKSITIPSYFLLDVLSLSQTRKQIQILSEQLQHQDKMIVCFTLSPHLLLRPRVTLYHVFLSDGYWHRCPATSVIGSFASGSPTYFRVMTTHICFLLSLPQHLPSSLFLFFCPALV